MKAEGEVGVLLVESTTNIEGFTNKPKWIKGKTHEPKSTKAVKGSSEGEHNKVEGKGRGSEEGKGHVEEESKGSWVSK